MDDAPNTGPFTQFPLPPAQPYQAPQTEPVAPASPEKKKRGRKKGVAAIAAAAGKKKPGRPKRVAAAVEAAAAPRPNPGRVHRPRKVMVELGTALSLTQGLTEDNAKFLRGVVQAMQAFSKKDRQRIAAALGKMFP